MMQEKDFKTKQDFLNHKNNLRKTADAITGIYDISHHETLLKTDSVKLLREAYLITKESHSNSLKYQIKLLKQIGGLMKETDQLRKKLKLKPKYHKNKKNAKSK